MLLGAPEVVARDQLAVADEAPPPQRSHSDTGDDADHEYRPDAQQRVSAELRTAASATPVSR